MCTAVVDIDFAAEHPVLLAGVRDEFHDRAWVGPGRHWPDTPQVVGGRDLLAGGTWLAADPDARRAATVLNGRGVLAPEHGRLSRGELPLRFAAAGEVGGLDYPRYDPFHLLCATLTRVFLLSWDGASVTRQELGDGLHLVVNSGLEAADGTEGPGTEQMAARVAHFRPLLAAARRPKPGKGGTTAQAWGEWLPVVDGAGLPALDDRALLVRRELGDRVWGTTSTTLVALRSDGLRYDFNPRPGEADAWETVIGD